MINVKNLNKNYGDKVIYSNFNIDIEENKTLVILGESGSGKTTFLNVLAGLTDFSGEIIGNISPVSMVFQKDYLVPNLTVYENLKLVCKGKDILTALKQVEMEDCINDYPKTLSGGMARRVAIVRALLFDSPLLLMDEPTNSLDLGLKNKIYSTLKTLKDKHPKTIVVVTHDIDEALALADRVVVVGGGEIKFSYEFISSVNERDITDAECNEVRKKLIKHLA